MSEHDHKHKQSMQVVNRVAKIEGHVRAVKEMALDGRDCPDLLLQIAAIRKALDAVGKVMLKNHLEQCVVAAVHQGDEQKIQADLQQALDHFIR